MVALHYRQNLVVPHVEAIGCEPSPPSPAETHPWLRGFDNQVRAGQSTAAQATRLKREGFTPDLIIGHPGWGETLFLKDVWPRSPMLLYPEYFHQPQGMEPGLDMGFGTIREDSAHEIRIRNTINFHALAAADRLWCPTEWQRSTFPEGEHPRIAVIHDGIDTDSACPKSGAKITITRDGQNHTFKPGDEVITFVNRNHEPVRGFNVFMRALPAILAQRPRANVILVGGDGITYGARPPSGLTWREHMLKELGGQLDTKRVHFVGKISKELFLAVLQVSALHVYLTYPFVVSWSLLEAMSCGCRVVANRAEPVLEFVEDGINGRLIDLSQPEELSATAVKMLGERSQFERLGLAARETIVRRCDLKSVCLPAQLRLIDGLVASAQSLPLRHQ